MRAIFGPVLAGGSQIVRVGVASSIIAISDFRKNALGQLGPIAEKVGRKFASVPDDFATHTHTPMERNLGCQ